ncbi:MAG: ferritin-like domain-containing protein [Minicystis sp.]
MSSEGYHEALDLISEETKNLHRGIVSLIEELEAIDWYLQRAEACSDPELKEVLMHHRNEEIEHAMMNLEWLRRKSSDFDEKMRTYLFSEGRLVDVEAREEGAAQEAGTAPSARAPAAPEGVSEVAPRRGNGPRRAGGPRPAGDGSLGIGSLKG